jgi:hypothetical protein
MIMAEPELALVRRNLIRFGPIQTTPDHLERVGLSAERYARYLTAFDRLGLANGVARTETGVVFEAERESLLNGEVTKGYLYSNSEPRPLVSDLDSYVPAPTPDSPRPRFIAFRRLKGNWYLFKASG